MDDRDIGRATFALDQLLSDPQLREILGAARDKTPVWFRDQMDAAVQQMDRRTADAVAAGKVVSELSLRTDEVPEWARLGLYHAFVTWVTGGGSTCMHSPHPMRPQPVVAAAWRPGLVVCGDCAHLFRLRGDADQTCDACGRVVGDEDEDEDLIYPGMLQLGAFTYLFGVCADDRYWEVASTEGTGTAKPRPKVPPV